MNIYLFGAEFIFFPLYFPILKLLCAPIAIVKYKLFGEFLLLQTPPLLNSQHLSSTGTTRCWILTPWQTMHYGCEGGRNGQEPQHFQAQGIPTARTPISNLTLLIKLTIRNKNVG